MINTLPVRALLTLAWMVPWQIIATAAFAKGLDDPIVEMLKQRDQRVHSYSFEVDYVILRGVREDPIDSIHRIVHEAEAENANLPGLLDTLQPGDARIVRSSLNTVCSGSKAMTSINRPGVRVIRFKDTSIQIDAIRQPQGWQADIYDARGGGPIWDLRHLGLTMESLLDDELTRADKTPSGHRLVFTVAPDEYITREYDINWALTKSWNEASHHTYVTKWYARYHAFEGIRFPQLILEYRSLMDGTFQVETAVLEKIQVNKPVDVADLTLSLPSPLTIIDHRKGQGKRAFRLSGRDWWTASAILDACKEGRPVISIKDAVPPDCARSGSGSRTLAIELVVGAVAVLTVGTVVAGRLRRTPK